MESSYTRDIGLIVIQHPDGELCLGEHILAPSPEKAVQTSAPASDNHILIHYLQRAQQSASTAALAEQRDRAHSYAATTLRWRKILFVILLVCDLLFFAGALFYKNHHAHVQQQGPTAEAAVLQLPVSNMTSTDVTSSSNISSSASTDGSHSSHPAITLTWWLDPQTIRGEDAVLSFAADLFGLTGALQNRAVVLLLYWVTQLLSTGSLSTTGGLTLSLFTIYRLLQLLLALDLRRAICTDTAQLEAAELAAESPTASHRTHQVLQRYPSAAALLGNLPDWQQQQHGRQQSQRQQ